MALGSSYKEGVKKRKLDLRSSPFNKEIEKQCDQPLSYFKTLEFGVTLLIVLSHHPSR